MKAGPLTTSILLGGALIAVSQARSDARSAPDTSLPKAAVTQPDWSEWTRPLSTGVPRVPAAPAAPAAAVTPAITAPAADEIDVVDAHWMALTMWGEGRGDGEAGMLAVGHVVRNRWLAKRHGAFVTDTVSQAWQFSAWNKGDPNRAAMLHIDALPPGSRDHRLWLAAKRLAAEILAGWSVDPTGGALFYHTTGVRPAWSRGAVPTAQIGSHLFFADVR